jgi:hypothetical protein
MRSRRYGGAASASERGGKFAARVQTELGVDVLQMRLDGTYGDGQPARDLGVRRAPRRQAGDVALTWCQLRHLSTTTRHRRAHTFALSDQTIGAQVGTGCACEQARLGEQTSRESIELPGPKHEAEQLEVAGRALEPDGVVCAPGARCRSEDGCERALASRRNTLQLVADDVRTPPTGVVPKREELEHVKSLPPRDVACLQRELTCSCEVTAACGLDPCETNALRLVQGKAGRVVDDRIIRRSRAQERAAAPTPTGPGPPPPPPPPATR